MTVMRANEWERQRNGKGNEGELSERERKKERSESELIKMSAELWKEKGERDEFYLARRDEQGWMRLASRGHACTWHANRTQRWPYRKGRIRYMSLVHIWKKRLHQNRAQFHRNPSPYTRYRLGVAWGDMYNHWDQMEWWINQRDYG